MFAAQRKEIIRDFLVQNRSVDIATLTNMLDVSDVTVRKDLDDLEKEGFLIKNHGGAVIAEIKKQSPSEFPIENYAEKEQIAELAFSLVEDGDSIFLGPGSTCYLFAKKLKSKKNITVVTNNINAVAELHPHINCVMLIGGEIAGRGGIIYSTGQLSKDYLKGVYVNKSFLSIEGVDLMAGFTVNDLSLSTILKQVPSFSKQLIFLADHTKFDKIGFYQIAPLDNPQCIVSNDRLDDSYKQYFYLNNIKVLTTINL